MADLPPYVDLAPYDVDPQDLLDRAIEVAQVTIPDWEPREGNVEVVLLEAQSAVTAESVYAINRLPAAIMESLLRLYGITPDEGAAPTVTVRFTLGDALGHDVPAGTRVALPAGGEGLDDLVFATDVALAIPPGSATGVVAATGAVASGIVNNTPPGTVLQVLDAVVFVDRAVTETAVVGGRSPETPDVYLDRASARLRRLVETLVLPEHFTARALEDPRVGRAFTIDNHDPGTAGVGDDPGHVTVAVLGADGAMLAAGVRGELAAAMDAQSSANLVVHVIDPTVTPVPVTATVKILPGWAGPDVDARATAAVADYLSPLTWSWAGTVRRFELIALLSNVPGVDFVVSLNAPAADVALAGAAPLASAGAIDVTVT